MIPEPFTLERPAVDWERHGRDERPKILPPPGAKWFSASGKTRQKHRFYSRTTTLAKTLEDSFAIAQWRIRRVLVGIGQRPDYQLAAASLTIEDHDRDALEKLGQACIEASGPSAALVGTALHSFTERIDRGEPVGYVPEAYRPLVEAWARITAPLRLEYREVRTVHDGLGAAGTPDAFGFCSLPDPDGVVDERRVIDLKSGSIKYPATMSAQLFIYADSDLYDPETGERAPLEVNRRWGLIVHLKSDSTEPPGLYWIDLEHGRRCVELAVPVREWRAVKPDEILVPALVEEVVPATPELDAAVVDISERLVVTSERVDPPATAAELEVAPSCNGLCVMGNEVLPGGGHYDIAAHPHPDCERHARSPERCELSDLLVSECACRVHRPDVPADALDDGDEVVELNLPDPPGEVDEHLAAVERCVTVRDLEVLWTSAGHLWTPTVRARAAEVMRELKERRSLERPRAALLAAITVADRARLRALWTEHHASSLWTDEHTTAAATRHAELGERVA